MNETRSQLAGEWSRAARGGIAAISPITRTPSDDPYGSLTNSYITTIVVFPDN